MGLPSIDFCFNFFFQKKGYESRPCMLGSFCVVLACWGIFGLLVHP